MSFRQLAGKFDLPRTHFQAYIQAQHYVIWMPKSIRRVSCFMFRIYATLRFSG
jgi:hypothetical protein